MDNSVSMYNTDDRKRLLAEPHKLWKAADPPCTLCTNVPVAFPFGRVSVRRNERIADLFFRMAKGERAGTGVRRINEAMADAGLTKPAINYDELFFFISFKRPSADSKQRPGSEKMSEKTSEKTPGRIFSALTGHPEATIA